MKLLAVTALVAYVTVVNAQFEGIPECAQTCLATSLPQECGFDQECICNSTDFINSITCCVSDACDTADQERTAQFARDTCEPVGVTDLPQPGDCPTGAGASSGTAAPSSTESSAESSTDSNMSMSTSDSPSSTSGGDSSTGSDASDTASTGSSSDSADAAEATPTDSANNLLAPGMGVMGMVALGVAALI